jgi:hypothetical protein
MWPEAHVGDLLLMTFKGACLGQRIMNTFGYRVKAITGGSIDVDVLYQRFIASADYVALQDGYLACLPSQYDLQETWLQVLFPARVRKLVLEVNLPGDLTTEVLQANSQASISRHTPFAHSGANGGIRVLAPQDDTYVVNGVLTNAYKILLGQLGDLMLEEINYSAGGATTDFEPVMLHRGAGGAFTADYLVAINVQDEVRTLRRRTVGRGE